MSQWISMAHIVAHVFDRYDTNNSIKSAERERRTETTASIKVYQIIERRSIPDWKTLTNPIRFHLMWALHSQNVWNLVIYTNTVHGCRNLFSTQEKAYTQCLKLWHGVKGNVKEWKNNHTDLLYNCNCFVCSLL